MAEVAVQTERCSTYMAGAQAMSRRRSARVASVQTDPVCIVRYRSDSSGDFDDEGAQWCSSASEADLVSGPSYIDDAGIDIECSEAEATGDTSATDEAAGGQLPRRRRQR